jgi:hypothetical protein
MLASVPTITAKNIDISRTNNSIQLFLITELAEEALGQLHKKKRKH